MRLADNREERSEYEDRKHKIGDGAGKHHQEPLPHRAELECMLAQIFRDAVELGGIARRGHVADELDVAPERDPRELPTGALPIGPAGKLTTKANRKCLRPNAEQARDQIMAKFMEKDERSKRANERDQHEPKWGLGKHF